MPCKIKVDRANCSGHARCAFVDAELFPLDDEGYSIADGVEVPAGKESVALRGVRSCPEQVLTLVDENGNAITKLP